MVDKNADTLLKELGERLKVGDLVFHEGGGCILVFDNEHIVEFTKEQYEKDGEIINISCSVGPIPTAPNSLELYRYMMEGNLFGQGTGGATLYIDRALGDIKMFDRLIVSRIDYQIFESVLETFLNYLEAWKEKYKPYAPEDDVLGDLRALAGLSGEDKADRDGEKGPVAKPGTGSNAGEGKMPGPGGFIKA